MRNARATLELLKQLASVQVVGLEAKEWPAIGRAVARFIKTIRNFWLLEVASSGHAFYADDNSWQFRQEDLFLEEGE